MLPLGMDWLDLDKLLVILCNVYHLNVSCNVFMCMSQAVITVLRVHVQLIGIHSIET